MTNDRDRERRDRIRKGDRQRRKEKSTVVIVSEQEMEAYGYTADQLKADQKYYAPELFEEEDDDGETVIVTVRIPLRDHRKIAEIAEARGMSRDQVTSDLVRAAIERVKGISR